MENVIGSEFDDTITGNSAANELAGGDGDDRLSAAAVDDTLSGGSGNDTFIFREGDGNDTITDFVEGASVADVIDVSDFGTDFDTLAEIQAAATDNPDGSTTIDFGTDTLTLLNVDSADLNANDFLF